MKIFLGYTFTYMYLTFIILLITILKNKLNLKIETSRKLIHILASFSWIIMAYYFKTSLHLIVPPLTFVLINYISYKTKLLSAIERTNDNSKGTVYYAISLVILSLITVINKSFLPFYGIGLFSMALGDGLAPFIGSKFNKLKLGNTNKTIAGSLTVFLCTLVISLIFSKIYSLEINIIRFLIISISASLLELIGNKGYDNLTLPIGVSLISYFLSIWR